MKIAAMRASKIAKRWSRRSSTCYNTTNQPTSRTIHFVTSSRREIGGNLKANTSTKQNENGSSTMIQGENRKADLEKAIERYSGIMKEAN